MSTVTVGQVASITHAVRHAPGGPDSLASLYAALDGTGKVALSQIPAGAFDLFYTTTNESTLLSLSIPAGQGAVVHIADDGTAQHNPELAFLPTGANHALLSSWTLTKIDPDGSAAALMASITAETARAEAIEATKIGYAAVTSYASFASVVPGTNAAIINAGLAALAAAGGGDYRLPPGYIPLEATVTVPAGCRLVMGGTPSQELAPDLAVGTVLVPTAALTGDMVVLAGASTTNENTGGSTYGGTIDAGTVAGRALHVTGTDCWTELTSFNGGNTTTVTIDSAASRYNWVHCWASNIAGSISSICFDLEAVDCVMNGGRMKSGVKMFNGGGLICSDMHLTGGNQNVIIGAPSAFTGCYFDSVNTSGNALITFQDTSPQNSVFTGCRYHQASTAVADIFQINSTTCGVNVIGGYITNETSGSCRFRSLLRFSAAAVAKNIPAYCIIVPPTVGSFTGIVTLTPQGQNFPYQTVAGSVAAGATQNGGIHLTCADSGGWPSTVVAGQAVEVAGVPSGTTILSVDTSSSLTMSAPATATASGLAINFIAAVLPAYAAPLVGQGGTYHPGTLVQTGQVPGGTQGNDGLVPLSSINSPGGWTWGPSSQVYPTSGFPTDAILGMNYVPQPGDTPLAFDPSTQYLYARALSPVTGVATWFGPLNAQQTIINGGT